MSGECSEISLSISRSFEGKYDVYARLRDENGSTLEEVLVTERRPLVMAVDALTDAVRTMEMLVNRGNVKLVAK
jgi:hypothetical protein